MFHVDFGADLPATLKVVNPAMQNQQRRGTLPIVKSRACSDFCAENVDELHKFSSIYLLL